MWLDQYNNLDSRVCLRIIEERLKSNFVQKTLCDMENEKKCDIYKFLVDNFCLQYYLVKPIPKLYKKCISKIRLSSHNLLIETGRHKNIPRDQRICPMCKLQFGQNSDIEDEYHFILICPTYRDLRKKFIKKYYIIGVILLCINLYSFSAQTMLEIYVTWANILRKHLKKDLLTSSTYMYHCYIY